MKHYYIIKNVRCTFIVATTISLQLFCADTIPTQAQYSYLDILLGRRRRAEKQELEAEINKRVDAKKLR